MVKRCFVYKLGCKISLGLTSPVVKPLPSRDTGDIMAQGAKFTDGHSSISWLLQGDVSGVEMAD